MDEELLTGAASVPVPERPVPPAPRRRLRWYVAAAAALVLVAGAGVAGVWAGAGGPPTTTPSSTTNPRTQSYYLPVSASSPAPGAVRLDFADQADLTGFDSYVIWRDGQLVEQVQPGPVPPYTLTGLDTSTRRCYQVSALVVTDRPPPAAPKPVCLVADGRNVPAGAATR